MSEKQINIRLLYFSVFVSVLHLFRLAFVFVNTEKHAVQLVLLVEVASSIIYCFLKWLCILVTYRLQKLSNINVR